MSEQENIDLGKVIGLIMENPALIEQISNLARGTPVEKQQESEPKADVPSQVETEVQKTSPTYSPALSRVDQRSNRAQLLGALKPYVSEERAKAIDSMISIANILDMMKAR